MDKTGISRTEISLRVRGILAEMTGRHPNEMRLEATFALLGLDLFDRVMLDVEIGEAFEVELDTGEVAGAVTVGAFIDLVEGAVRAREAL